MASGVRGEAAAFMDREAGLRVFWNFRGDYNAEGLSLPGIIPPTPLGQIGFGPSEFFLFFGIDPCRDYCSLPPHLTEKLSLQCFQWGSHRIHVGASCGKVLPQDRWKSGSVDSGALYPWVWDFPSAPGNCYPGSLALQILPGDSCTSTHYHLHGIADGSGSDGIVAETHYPLHPDGKTYYRTPLGIRRLWHPVTVKTKETHCLYRIGKGISVQLIRMYSPLSFHCKSDHHPASF